MTAIPGWGGVDPEVLTALRPVPIGTQGAVSWEGTAAGTVASAGVGLLGAWVGLYPLAWVPAVIAGAACGATLESVAGVILGRRGLLGNESLNFLNTAVGAGICFLLGLRFGV